jgi:Ala-tRNA(Pro) deacylase
MSAIHRWLEYFNAQQIPYSHSTHPRARTARRTARAEGVPARDLAKTVVYRGNYGFGIAVVAADELVDLRKVGRLLGLSNIRLANEVELAELFPDCELGAMPPFGDACHCPPLSTPAWCATSSRSWSERTGTLSG